MALLGNVATTHDKLVHQRMMYQACAHGQEENVKRLLWQRPFEYDEPNEFGISPVMICASHGHDKIMDHLIDLGEKLLGRVGLAGLW